MTTAHERSDGFGKPSDEACAVAQAQRRPRRRASSTKPTHRRGNADGRPQEAPQKAQRAAKNEKGPGGIERTNEAQTASERASKLRLSALAPPRRSATCASREVVAHGARATVECLRRAHPDHRVADAYLWQLDETGALAGKNGLERKNSCDATPASQGGQSGPTPLCAGSKNSWTASSTGCPARTRR